MDEIKLEKSKIIARQILLYFIDFHNAILPLFDKGRIYRVPLKAYWKFRQEDKIKFSQELYRLKQRGMVKEYLKGKEPSLELTGKGKGALRKYLSNQFVIKKPPKWDKKWRLVIFDIPDDKRSARDILRHKLESLGFFELQESVYVYPFECKAEIELLKKLYYISPYVQYVIADRIETETDLIEQFYNQGVLTDKMM